MPRAWTSVGSAGLDRHSMVSAISPDRRARSIRFLTEEGDHLLPPRGVRSCNCSS